MNTENEATTRGSAAGTLSVARWWTAALSRKGRFAQVAGHVGRLLGIFGEIQACQIKRRLPLVGSNVHAHLSDMVAQGALARSDQGRGRYVRARLIPCADGDLPALLLTVLAVSEEKELPLDDLLASHLLFPFAIDKTQVAGDETLQVREAEGGPLLARRREKKAVGKKAAGKKAAGKKRKA